MLIDGLSVDEQRQQVSALGQVDLGHLELAPGRTALQVGYLAPGFGPADGVRYQIKLEGVDQDWSPPSDQRTVNYANIGPGRYRFAVRALTADGILSSNAAGFEFHVLTPVWQRWWFLSDGLHPVRGRQLCASIDTGSLALSGSRTCAPASLATCTTTSART